jgi:glutathione S-transferase
MGAKAGSPMTYILHHMPGSRSTRVLWLMEELGLDYELKLKSREAIKTVDYLTVSPLGIVPALEADGGVILESGAILQYLLAKHSPTPLQVEKDQPGFAAYLQWFHFGEGTFTHWMLTYVRNAKSKPEAERIPAAADEALIRLKAQLNYIGAELGKRAYVAGDHFTAADIMLGYSLHVANKYGALEGAPQSIHDYLARMVERPAFGRAAFS